jgi:hypothetical protein
LVIGRIGPVAKVDIVAIENLEEGHKPVVEFTNSFTGGVRADQGILSAIFVAKYQENNLVLTRANGTRYYDMW